MKTTTYYDTIVQQKHAEVKREWVEWVLAHPIRREAQTDGRLRF